MTDLKNDNFYKEGYSIALENSQSLSLIADKAAEVSKFGIACSLNILAAEEAIKAAFLIVKHYGKSE